MNKVAITTNSACIFADEAKEKGITIIPFHIIIGRKDYPDPQVDMESLYCSIYRSLASSRTSPGKTSRDKNRADRFAHCRRRIGAYCFGSSRNGRTGERCN